MSDAPPPAPQYRAFSVDADAVFIIADDAVGPEKDGLWLGNAMIYLASDVDPLLAALRVRAEGLQAENKELEDEVEDREQVIHNFEASDEQKQIRINELTAELTALRASQETLQAELAATIIARDHWTEQFVLADKKVAALDTERETREVAIRGLPRYETQEIESLQGLTGHEDWVRADALDAVLSTEPPAAGQVSKINTP